MTYQIAIKLEGFDEWVGADEVSWDNLPDAIEAFDALLVGPRGCQAKALLQNGERILVEWAGASIPATPAWARKAAA